MSIESLTVADAARDWDAKYPAAPVSLFACRFPGRYREAADALRLVRNQISHDKGPGHAELAGHDISTDQPLVCAGAGSQTEGERA
jgi:hypothetical protein